MLANRIFEKIAVLGIVMCFLSTTSKAGEMILHPCEDVFIQTTGDGWGYQPFMKFDISGVPADEQIDSVFLEVRVTDSSGNWQGDVIFWNVNSQTWDESTPFDTIWNIPISDATPLGGFGLSLGWTRAGKLDSIFLKDYNAGHNFCSLRLKSADDPADEPQTSNDSLYLRLGNSLSSRGYIEFMSSEDSVLNRPKLVVYYTETNVPDIEVSDTLYDFGVVTIGDSTDWTDLWIKNVGDSTLEILGIIPSNTVFSIVSPSFPVTIDTLDSLAVTVRFKPTNAIVYTDSLTIHSNDPDEPEVIVQVSGEGRARAPDIEVSDTLYDFGVVIVGNSIDWADLWIKNVGDTTLSILGIIPTNDIFSIISPPFPTTINSLDSLAVTIKFTPPDTLVYSSLLIIRSDDPDEDPVIVQVFGKGGMSRVEENYNIPSEPALLQNYPNPFTTFTAISYRLSVKSKTSLKVYDMGGRLVRTLVDEEKEPGYYRVAWNTRCDVGRRVPPGIYFYRLKTPTFTTTKKLIILQ